MSNELPELKECAHGCVDEYENTCCLATINVGGLIMHSVKCQACFSHCGVHATEREAIEHHNRRASGWIYITPETMPEAGTEYLIGYEGGCSFGYYAGSDPWEDLEWEDLECGPIRCPLAYQPVPQLPEPPKAETMKFVKDDSIYGRDGSMKAVSEPPE